MMKVSSLWVPLLALVAGSSGCTNTVRYLSTSTWLIAPGGVGVPSAPSGAAPTGAAAQTAQTAAAALAPAAPSGSGSEGMRTFYITFWEGTCSSGFLGFGKGCDLGDSKIRRCNPKPDNTMDCVEEAEANQAFARKK